MVNLYQSCSEMLSIFLRFYIVAPRLGLLSVWWIDRILLAETVTSCQDSGFCWLEFDHGLVKQQFCCSKCTTFLKKKDCSNVLSF
jgi:hypothetical protein